MICIVPLLIACGNGIDQAGSPVSVTPAKWNVQRCSLNVGKGAGTQKKEPYIRWALLSAWRHLYRQISSLYVVSFEWAQHS
jgi:hypothetical protein